MYKVYILECADGTYYTGITTDIERRLHEHNFTERGAKYTKNRRPCRLVYCEYAEGRPAASKREYAIKKLSRSQKKKLAESWASPKCR